MKARRLGIGQNPISPSPTSMTFALSQASWPSSIFIAWTRLVVHSWSRSLSVLSFLPILRLIMLIGAEGRTESVKAGEVAGCIWSALISSIDLRDNSQIIFDRREVFSGTTGCDDCRPCFLDNVSRRAWRIGSSMGAWREQNLRSASSLSFGLMSLPFNMINFGNKTSNVPRFSSSFPLNFVSFSTGAEIVDLRESLRFSSRGSRLERWASDAREKRVVSSRIKVFNPSRGRVSPSSIIGSRGLEDRLSVSRLMHQLYSGCDLACSLWTALRNFLYNCPRLNPTFIQA